MTTICGLLVPRVGDVVATGDGEGGDGGGGESGAGVEGVAESGQIGRGQISTTASRRQTDADLSPPRYLLDIFTAPFNQPNFTLPYTALPIV